MFFRSQPTLLLCFFFVIGSSSLPVPPSNGTTVAVSASPGNTNITSVTNTSVTGENSTVSYLSTSPPNVSHNASTTSEKNASINRTSIAPLASTTEKQESTIATSLPVSYSMESVSKSGFFSTTGSIPLESSSRTENNVQSNLFSSASTASVSHGSSVETTIAAGSADGNSKENLGMSLKRNYCYYEILNTYNKFISLI